MSKKEWPKDLEKVQITLLGETKGFGANTPDEIAIADAIAWLGEKQREMLRAREHGQKAVTTEEKLERVIGALADIAFSRDLTLDGVRRKAKRIYEEVRAEELAAETKGHRPDQP
jgi:hypothetical protein